MKSPAKQHKKVPLNIKKRRASQWFFLLISQHLAWPNKSRSKWTVLPNMEMDGNGWMSETEVRVHDLWTDLSLSQMHKTRCYDYSPLHLPTSLSVKGHSLEHLARTISLHVASLNAFTHLLDYSKHLPSNNSEETVAWPWWKISRTRRNCWNLIQFWYVLVLLIAALLVSAVTTGCGWLGVGLSDMAEDPRVSWILHDDPKKWHHWWQQRY